MRDIGNDVPFLTVLDSYIAVFDQWIGNQIITVEIFSVHINGSYLMVIVGFIIIDSFACIAAGRVDCIFI